MSRKAPWRRARRLKGMGYAAPVAVFVAVFFVAPLLLVGQMSVRDWPLLRGDQGANFPDNYTAIADNPLFWPAVGFTLKYTAIVVVALLALSLLMALIVQESRPGTGFYRTVYFLPATLGLASASLLFWGFYSPSIGPVNTILTGLGLIDEPISFTGSPGAALTSTVVLIVWKFAGFFMLILLVGLQAIPAEVYEAARMDGANRRQIFTRITLPLLRPSLGLVSILSVTGSLLAFDQFFILTKGGPDNASNLLLYYIYQTAFSFFDTSYAATLTVVLLALLGGFALVQFQLIERRVHYR